MPVIQHFPQPPALAVPPTQHGQPSPLSPSDLPPFYHSETDHSQFAGHANPDSPTLGGLSSGHGAPAPPQAGGSRFPGAYGSHDTAAHSEDPSHLGPLPYYHTDDHSKFAAPALPDSPTLPSSHAPAGHAPTGLHLAVAPHEEDWGEEENEQHFPEMGEEEGEEGEEEPEYYDEEEDEEGGQGHAWA
ncbi:hypothetical protein AYL99_07832 [Fonsecaea erecta]|uniref:Uncharacterized protein n=1 Tax=Fonsecaea erecta TaxID=1367422 RepID=A0A178ZGH3_9EURO|nr:hypothetical protein AYL99_07832 [Fonsecaea erecta]OAP58742.1 hypothetical protein AYL99_07832 [Fonsecaea erecta]